MPDYPLRMSLRNYIQYLPTQGNSECCTSSATLLAAEITMATQNIKINFSRLYVYYMTRKLQGRIGQRGAELKYALDCLMSTGVPSESRWPFSDRRVDLEPNAHAMEEAVHYKLRSYESVTTAQFKYYLNQEIPIIIGMITGRKFWNISGTFDQHAYTPVNDIDNRPSKGHAVTIIGYDDEINGGSWIIANSFGPKWGYQGYAAIPYTCNIDIGEAYIITNFAGITAGKKIS